MDGYIHRQHAAGTCIFASTVFLSALDYWTAGHRAIRHSLNKSEHLYELNFEMNIIAL